MKTAMRALAAASLVAMATAAGAATIIDTGPGAATGGGGVIGSSQWSAGQFTLTEATTLTSAGIWGGAFSTAHLTVRFYQLDFTAVGSATSQNIAANTSSSNHWMTVDGLDVTLGPGTYWLAFESNDPVGHGYAAVGAPSTLAGYALTLNQGTNWQSASGGIGYQLFGDPAAVPEPANWAMLITGFGLVGGMLRGQRRALENA